MFDAARGESRVGGAPPAGDAGLPGLDLALAEWESDSFAFHDFDRYVEALAADAPGGVFEIRLSGETGRLPAAARQIVTRCQRLAARRNAASAGELFDRVLACHRRFRDLPDPPRPLGRPRPRQPLHPPPPLQWSAAGYAHALDTWQWLLRLDPEAGLALQLAALFHEAWRLVPEPRTDGEAGGDAVMGAWMADELLADLGIDLPTRVRVHRLIAGHPRPPAAFDA
ncbi:MAG: hypothetical protein JOZ15_16740, partial [Acidobacteria bacterium]|nr:hypothetical protein [Acidobacteriota bacterium]